MTDTFPSTLGAWWASFGQLAVAGLRILVIALAAVLAIHALKKALQLFHARVSLHVDDREVAKRAETLSRVIRYLITVVITLIAGMLILDELGISVAPILGAAGVVGLAVGFGAQSLVKDYFTGFFILLENQIRQGDVVRLGSHAGLVEEVTLRYVRLRDYEGKVYFIPNSTITVVINHSRSFSNAVMDITVAYRENTDVVADVLRQVGAGLRADPVFGPRILGDLEVAGVDSLGESGVVIRSRFRCQAMADSDVRREFLRRAKAAFDAGNIELARPHLTVVAGTDKQGHAAAFTVRQVEGAAVPSDRGV